MSAPFTQFPVLTIPADDALITATGGVTSSSLANRFGNIKNVNDDFGAKGNGTTDDTVALQAALNTHKFVALVPDCVYAVTNLSVPAVQPDNSFVPLVGFICPNGTARIKKLTSSDNSYMIASSNWINNNPFANYPAGFTNIAFDGNSIAQDIFVDVSFSSTYETCFFENGTRSGHLATGTTKNGTPIGNTTENLQFISCGANHNGSYGLYNDGHATDTEIRGGYYHNNGDTDLYLLETAGLLLNGAKCYSTTRSFYFEDFGFNEAVSGCDFESACEVHTFNNSTHLGTILNCDFSGNLTIFGATSGAGAVPVFVGWNRFSGSAGIYLQYNAADRYVLSAFNGFKTASPYTYNGAASSLTSVYAINDFSYDGAFSNGGIFTGPQVPTGTGASVPNQYFRRKALSATGTTTTFVFVYSVNNFQMAGFSITGDIRITSLDGSGNLDTYQGTVQADFVRKISSTADAHGAQMINEFCVHSTITVGVVVSPSNTVTQDTVTVTITITAPQAPNTNPNESYAQLDLYSYNRNVQTVVLT